MLTTELPRTTRTWRGGHSENVGGKRAQMFDFLIRGAVSEELWEGED